MMTSTLEDLSWVRVGDTEQCTNRVDNGPRCTNKAEWLVRPSCGCTDDLPDPDVFCTPCRRRWLDGEAACLLCGRDVIMTFTRL